MKIGIISDSHGNIECIIKALEKIGEADLWLHCGDYGKDALFIKKYTQKDVIAVQGNCDSGIDYKIDEFIEIFGKKIWLTHGHRYKIKHSKNELLWWAKQYEIDIVIYGHTHIAENIDLNNIILFNPGSVSIPRHGNPSCGLLEITDEIVKFEIIQL